MAKQILVTGAAGFIGHAVCEQLCQQGASVTGIDNINDYYDVGLKRDRLATLKHHSDFRFRHLDINDQPALAALFDSHDFDCVIHLAAQAGVRYSISHPFSYGDANLRGFLSLLEVCRHHQCPHLVFASSSSVYGLNQNIPFSENDPVDHPVSLYAATKKANELMAHSYAHLYNLPITGLRFFTVYGPWGRPDMAPIKFARAILSGEAIDVYNHGEMRRDFTYIDDIVTGVLAVSDCIPEGHESWQPESGARNESSAPYRIVNIGRGEPVGLMDFIEQLEIALGKQAEKRFLPMQPGDVHETFADISALTRLTGYRPAVSVSEGVAKFAQWVKAYYSLPT